MKLSSGVRLLFPYFHIIFIRRELGSLLLFLPINTLYTKTYETMDKSKRIGTFKQFLKEQKVQKLNEAKVNIECDFWDEAQVEIMQILSDECDGFLTWDTLVKYVKNKFQILGREDPGYEEALLLQHIKDLIFQLHGDSLYTDGKCDWGDKNAEIQAKGLVVGELSKAILDKVLDTVKTSDDPIPGTTSVSLTDKEPRTLVPMKPAPTICDDEEDYYDDLPFENKRPVKKFNEYSKSLNETVGVGMIETSCQEKCIQFCLDRIKADVGSFDPDEIFNVAGQAADPKVKARLVLLYVKDMVIDYLSSEKAQLAVVNVNGNKGKDIPKEVLEQGLDKLYKDIADEVLVKIAEINGLFVEDGEAE